LNYEVQVIIIDDCSDINYYDNYYSSVKDAFPKIIIQRCEIWIGIGGGARNIGVNISNSKYLLFVDSDDILRKNAISTLMKYSSEKRIVFANHIKVIDNDVENYNKGIFLNILKECQEIMDYPILYSNFICVPVIIPRILFNKVGGYPESIYSGEYVSLWGRLYFESNIEEILYIDEVLYEYYPRENGNSHSNIELHVTDKCKQFEVLANSLFLKVKRYVCYKSKSNFPSLYVPVFENERQYIPPWAEIENDLWNVSKKYSYINYKQPKVHCIGVKVDPQVLASDKRKVKVRELEYDAIIAT
jgi:hypothetical protein